MKNMENHALNDDLALVKFLITTFLLLQSHPLNWLGSMSIDVLLPTSSILVLGFTLISYDVVLLRVTFSNFHSGIKMNTLALRRTDCILDISVEIGDKVSGVSMNWSLLADFWIVLYSVLASTNLILTFCQAWTHPVSSASFAFQIPLTTFRGKIGMISIHEHEGRKLTLWSHFFLVRGTKFFFFFCWGNFRSLRSNHEKWESGRPLKWKMHSF